MPQMRDRQGGLMAAQKYRASHRLVLKKETTEELTESNLVLDFKNKMPKSF